MRGPGVQVGRRSHRGEGRFAVLKCCRRGPARTPTLHGTGKGMCWLRLSNALLGLRAGPR
jgi:hypothetical protein